MIEPTLGLSFNVHSQKGTFALLVGSGVSRGAEIPTGWEVTLDLVRQLAFLQGESCEGREVEWYLAKYGVEPNYSTLLSAVAPTSAAQQQVLRRYFEPTEEQRADGRKSPTLAHKAIAELVAKGYCRVIVTTNFDRLLESALEAIGVAPVVVASADAVEGMPPLAHTRCTIIKVHGDYLDHRIKNSPEALETYDRSLNKLLDQVWDEYGLIVCGWSADYDTALRASIKRCKSRRYPTYWVLRSPPKAQAKSLIALRGAQVIQSIDADVFFKELAEKLEALDVFDRPHPLSTEAAVAMLKKYLSEDRHRINLRELLEKEAVTARSAIVRAFEYPPDKKVQEQFVSCVAGVEAACDRLASLLQTGAHFATAEQARFFGEALHAASTLSALGSGYTVMLDLRKYPALLLAYCVGIASLLSEEFGVLTDIAYRQTSLRADDEDRRTLPDRVDTTAVGDRDAWNKWVFGEGRWHVPVSQHLQDVLEPRFAAQCPTTERFEHVFDEFEMVWSLLHVEAQQVRGEERIWAPPGTFLWRRAGFRSSGLIERVSLAADGKKDWAPLKGGLFGGSTTRLKAVLDAANASWIELRRYYH